MNVERNRCHAFKKKINEKQKKKKPKPNNGEITKRKRNVMNEKEKKKYSKTHIYPKMKLRNN